MQIQKIVLYGKNAEKRILNLRLGQLNIISGKSKTGKSVIGDIIDYCFGGSSCNIAVGVVRDTTDWYGLLLEHNRELLFVARQNPPVGQASTGKCCYQFGVSDVPDNVNFAAPVDVAGLEKLLSQKIGISENLFTPPEGQSRQPLSANIRHAMFYCIQGQDEIAAQKILFHKQSEQFVPQAIKDTLPYFLGIVNEHNLELAAERTRLRRECLIIQRSIDEVQQLQGNGLERATALIEEARNVGLISDNNNIDLNDYISVRSALKEACLWNPVDVRITGMDRISYLQTQIHNDQVALENCDIDIRNAKEFLNESSGYSTEVLHQISRLQSIGLFEAIDFTENHCPLCSAELSQPLPCATDIQNAVKRLSENLSSAKRDQPQINSYIEQLQQERQKITNRIKTAKADIEAIYAENKETIAFKDLNARRARIVGRISLWLESVIIKDDSAIQKERMEKKKQRIEEIDGLLSEDLIEESKQSIINRLSVEMTKWAQELQLEHCDYPYRLDINKVTVVVDRERPVPLQQLGSGSNWLGCHLIALFALHKFFIQNHRPVPQFLFIDQPSQVYFPPETNDDNVDSQEIRTIFGFIQKRIQELAPNMQVIIVDHADIQEKYFQDAVVEKWWDKGQCLIPLSWIQS
jgi:hypothetical protein